MSKVTMLVGLSGSGKSTLARKWVEDYPNMMIVCRDDIRAAHGFPPVGSHEQEAKVTKIQRGQIEAALLDGFDVIVADTNLNKSIRNSLIRFCHKHGADVTLVPLAVDVDTCIERDALRDQPVGEKVIRKQNATMNKNPIGETYFPARRFSPVESDDSKPSAIIVDIDGTVARHVGRSPYDYTKVHTDQPIQNVISMIDALSDADCSIVFMSGRSEDCREETEEWLSRHIYSDYELFMRASGDNRPDWEIKGELWDEHIVPKYNVLAAFDDRDQVVKMLRSRGVTVMQVNYGRF